jgi:hypothetical protein
MAIHSWLQLLPALAVGAMCSASLISVALTHRYVVGGVGDLPARFAWIGRAVWAACAFVALAAVAFMIDWISVQASTGLAEAIAMALGLGAGSVGWFFGVRRVDRLRAAHMQSHPKADA